MRNLIQLFCILSITCFSHAESIILTSVDGRSLQATITGLEDGEVFIVRQDGNNYKIPLKNLDDDSKTRVAAEIKKLNREIIDRLIKAVKEDAAKSKTDFTKKDLSDAYYTSRNFIKNTLKAPSTAKFSNPITDQQTTGSNITVEGRIQSKGIVEAQNSFGVPLKDHWMVVLQPEGDQWRVVFARLGDKVLMDTRNDHKTDGVLKAEEFIGIPKISMVEVFGEPLEVKNGSHTVDGSYSIYVYSNEKGKETFFTIWDSEELISSGSYLGNAFNK